MARPKKTKTTTVIPSMSSYFDKLEQDLKDNQSTLSMVLGALIILILGVLIFNYSHMNKGGTLGPSQSTSQEQANQPKKYTVKEGDTLFQIANNYYQDGYKYTEIAKANNLANADSIDVGQVLTIPTITATATPATVQSDQSGGSPDMTNWGAKITPGSQYTVVQGDWLSTIAGRAYGDIYAYQKIVDANNIQNPNDIEPGTVLTIPQ